MLFKLQVKVAYIQVIEDLHLVECSDEQRQILWYNSNSCFNWQVNSKRFISDNRQNEILYSNRKIRETEL